MARNPRTLESSTVPLSEPQTCTVLSAMAFSSTYPMELQAIITESLRYTSHIKTKNQE